MLPSPYVFVRTLCDALYGRIILARIGPRYVVLKESERRLTARHVCRSGEYVFEDVAVERTVLRSIRGNPHPGLVGMLPSEFNVTTDEFMYTALPYYREGELLAHIPSGFPEASGVAISSHSLRRSTTSTTRLGGSLGVSHRTYS